MTGNPSFGEKGHAMAERDKQNPATLQELMVSTLVMADAITKLLIEKAIISETEFR
jgi:hypothetical protein